MWKLISLIALLLSFTSVAQFNWTWTELDTNQAVSNRAFLLGNPSAYIDEITSTLGFDVRYYPDRIVIGSVFSDPAKLISTGGQVVQKRKEDENITIIKSQSDSNIYVIEQAGQTLSIRL